MNLTKCSASCSGPSRAFLCSPCSRHSFPRYGSSYVLHMLSEVVALTLDHGSQMQPDSRSQRIANARKVMRRMGMKLITKKKSEILRLAADGEKEKGNLQSRDVLTLLIKANMATDLPESHRLSDEDVLAREQIKALIYTDAR